MRAECGVTESSGHTFQCLALCEVSVVTLGEETRLVTSDNTLEEASGNLKGCKRRAADRLQAD